jgi:hypothetical protein
MQARSNPCCGLVITDSIYSIEDFYPLGRTPAGDKCASERRIQEVDCQRVVDDASRT